MKRDYREAALSPGDRAMLDFASLLTRAPMTVTAADLHVLRQHGFDDASIHDIVQAAALFAYYNRLADGLGVKHEP